MNIFDLYENREPHQVAIDKLENERIAHLERKMDELAIRAEETDDPKVKSSLRHEFAKVKAERDSYHKLNIEEVGEDGTNYAYQLKPDPQLSLRSAPNDTENNVRKKSKAFNTPAQHVTQFTNLKQNQRYMKPLVPSKMGGLNSIAVTGKYFSKVDGGTVVKGNVIDGNHRRNYGKPFGLEIDSNGNIVNKDLRRLNDEELQAVEYNLVVRNKHLFKLLPDQIKNQVHESNKHKNDTETDIVNYHGQDSSIRNLLSKASREVGPKKNHLELLLSFLTRKEEEHEANIDDLVADNTKQRQEIEQLVKQNIQTNKRYQDQENRFRILTAKVANTQLTPVDVKAAKQAKGIEQQYDSQPAVTQEGQMKKLTVDPYGEPIKNPKIPNAVGSFTVLYQKEGQWVPIKIHMGETQAKKHALAIKKRYPGMVIGIKNPMGKIISGPTNESDWDEGDWEDDNSIHAVVKPKEITKTPVYPDHINRAIEKNPQYRDDIINTYMRKQSMAEGYQDFKKPEPYYVCLAGKPVKQFDYYEQARQFHDNWKKKLYREGNQEKADKITLMPVMDEAADTNYTYTVFIDGTKEGTYGSQEEARAVVRRKKEQAPGRDYRIKAKARTSMSSIKKFQRSKDVDEGSMTWASQKPTGPKFGGYLKGTDPAPTEYSKKSVGGCEEDKTVGEGIAGNMTARSNPLTQPLRKRQHMNRNTQISLGKHNNNLKAAAARSLDEMTDDEIAKLRNDAESYAIKQMAAPKKSQVPTKKGFFKDVGDRQIGMVKGAWKGLTDPDSLKESDNFLSWAVRNGYKINKPAIYESAKKAYKKALSENSTFSPYMQNTIQFKYGDEAKSSVLGDVIINKKVHDGAAYNVWSKKDKKYYDVSPQSLTPAKKFNMRETEINAESKNEDGGPIAPHETYYGAMDESLRQGEYHVWTVHFDDGTSKRLKVTSDEFDPYSYYAKKNQVVVNVDYNWEIHQ